MSLPALCLIRAIESDFADKAQTDGFTAIITAYFNEYTDATEIDPHAYSAMEALFDICFPSGENNNEKTLDDLIADVKAELGR